jgi:hypothetical protein
VICEGDRVACKVKPILKKILSPLSCVGVLCNGKFYGKNDGSEGSREIEFYTFPNEFIRAHHNASSSWQKVRLRGLEAEIEQYEGEKGFEQIAKVLGIPKPLRERAVSLPASQ